jgi:DNA-binding transcriptional regulator YhcF (GntR family)
MLSWLKETGTDDIYGRQRDIWTSTMPTLSVDAIFDAAIRIQLEEEKGLSLNFSEHQLSVKFPTTRRLAEFLNVPHYYVLPYFAMMEQDQLVTRAERVGIMTTMQGTKKIISMMNERYRPEAIALLGPEIFEYIVKRVQPQRSD